MAIRRSGDPAIGRTHLAATACKVYRQAMSVDKETLARRRCSAPSKAAADPVTLRLLVEGA